MTDLFGFRRRAPESQSTGVPGGGGLEGLRARGDAMLEASGHKIASVQDAERWLTQNRQRGGQ